MTYLQVLFGSYIGYAVSSACNTHPRPCSSADKMYTSLNPPLKFFLFRKPLAPDSQ